MHLYLIYIGVHGERELGKRKVCLMPQWKMRRGEEESSRLSVYHREREIECVCVQECSVTPSCLVLCNPMDYINCQAPLSMGFPSKILEWIAISFSRGSSQIRAEPRSLTSPALVAGFFTTGLSGKMVTTVVIRRQLPQW